MSLALIVAMSVEAHAQPSVDTGEGPRVRWGPVTLAPDLSFATLVDTNVFNESEAPKQDVVIRAIPRAEGRLSLGPLQGQFLGSVNAVHFRRYRDQSTLDVTTLTRLDFDLSRIVPYVSASIVRTRERPGLDIDIRPLRLNRAMAAGVTVKLTAKTALVLGGFQERVQYDEDAVFRDLSLREGLDRRREGATAALRYDVTPITSLALTVERDVERFTFMPDRNAESLRVLPSVEFNPGGLLNGRASVGYRRFRPDDEQIPRFIGTTATIELSYVLREGTRFGVRVNRDLVFSYNPAEPYFLLTAFHVTISRYFTDRLRLTGSFGKQRLDYRQFAGSSQDSGQQDGLSAGVAFMFVTNRDVSFGVTVDRAERSSRAALPGYDGLRTGVVFNYGH